MREEATEGEQEGVQEGSTRPRLVETPTGLELHDGTGAPVRAAVTRLAERRRGRDLLGRAVGKGLVVDATAGLGGDGFNLAAAGHDVIMIERERALVALLEDGLRRATRGDLGADAVSAAARVRLIEGDARLVLPDLAAGGMRPDAVLLDPMYPATGKAARPRKEMALLRDWLGEDDGGAAELLAVALDVAAARVVVKRPAKAPLMPGPKPTGSVRGSTTRYDIYAPNVVRFEGQTSR